MRIARLLPALLLPLAAACAPAPKSAPTAAGLVTVGVVAFNDFHGSLEPPKQAVTEPDGKSGTLDVPAGGAAWLAGEVKALQAKYPYHLTVSAGDLISASQLPSSLYLDEPAIGVANRIGLDFNAVGNHEFDRGRTELLRMQRGGCAKNTSHVPCALEPFTGAKFQFLSASTLTEDGTPLFPGSALRTFGDGAGAVKVGVIGLTLKGTPAIVNPVGIKGLTFIDEADAINTEAMKLKAMGADAVVVLIHQGGVQAPDADPNACAGFSGDIREVVDRLAPSVDVVVSGHTHKSYVCELPEPGRATPLLLTSAGLYGKLVTEIVLQIDPAAHRVVARSAHNQVVASPGYIGAKGAVAPVRAFPQVRPDPEVAAYIARYVMAAKAETLRPIGKLSGPASGRALGQLIADAQLAATRGAGAEIAFMNPFGVRAAVVPAGDGTVTFGDLYAAQPFGSALETFTLSGAELKAAMEQSFAPGHPEQVLTPSAGFALSYDRTRPLGQRITAMTLNGAAIDPKRDYRITVSSFLAQGGDGFTVFKTGRANAEGGTDIDALEAWIKAVAVREVPVADRAGSVR